MVTDFTAGQEEEAPSSSCRARSAAEQRGGVGTNTQTNVCGYRRRNLPGSRQDCYEFIVPRRATKLTATTPAISFDLPSSM